MKRNFITSQVSNIWNSLFANVAEADTVNVFKNGLNRLCCLKKSKINVDFDFQNSYTLSRLLKS